MSQGEREQLFEKALQRQLRAGELDGEICADTCPDAETMAAYHERSLAMEEMNRCKEHIATCERCQAILAGVEESEHIPVATLKPAEARVAHGASVMAAMQGPPRGIASVTEMKPRRLLNMKWIAPAAAIAAGLLVWIAVKESSRSALELAQRSRGAVAKHEAAPPGDSESPKQEYDSNELRRSAQTATTTPRSPEPMPPSTDLARNEPARITPFSQKVVPPVNGRTRAPGPSNYAFQQNAIQQNAQPQSAGGVAGDLSAAGKNDQQITATERAPNAATGMATAPPVAAPPPPAPAPPGEETAILDRKDLPQERVEKEKKEVANQRAAANRDATARSAQDLVTLSMAASVAEPAAADVIAPDGKSIWRIAGNGKVSHSTDGGKNWKLQNTGVSATLLAGSAPSEKVCWLAGTFGTVLLTTDGGAHWMKQAAPVSVPIAEIHAKDAENAVITLQSSLVQFATYNGGQSWTILTEKTSQQ
jgi:hypothetical protein